LTVIDFGNARVGAGIVTVGAAGAAATSVGRNGCLPTGVLGFSVAAGTETGAFDDLVAAAGGTTFAGAFSVLAAALGAADFGGAFFDVTFGGAFVGLGGAAFVAFGAGFAFCPFATTLVAFVDFAATFGAGLAFGAGFTFALAAFAVAFVAVPFAATLAFAAGFAGVFLTTFAVFVTFVALPLTLPFGAGLVFFAVANLISSAVFSSVFVPTRIERPNFENA
jgi:hypothetical protein